MKLYKLKKEYGYITQEEDTNVEQPLEWWIGKHSLMVEKYLQELCECRFPTPDKGECRGCEMPLRTEENED